MLVTGGIRRQRPACEHPDPRDSGGLQKALPTFFMGQHGAQAPVVSQPKDSVQGRQAHVTIHDQHASARLGYGPGKVDRDR